MGWLFTTGIDKSDLIRERTETSEFTNRDGDKIKHESIRHCCKGNTLWSVIVVHKNDVEVARFIGCDLLRKGHGGWGYKDMEESMGPCYYSCPLSYLDLAPVTNTEWREQVKEYHKKRSRKLEVGKTYDLVNARGISSARIISLRPLKGIADNGQIYRIPKRMIGEELATV